jgi:hypothetical protein
MEVGDQAKKNLPAVVDAAIGVQQPTVEKYIERAKQRNPSATPSQVIASLERQYLSTVSAIGGVSGAAAAAPAVGRSAELLVNVVEVGAFIEASALFCLAVAEVHGVQIDDLERRRTLVMGVLMGTGGSQFVEKAAGRTGPHWAKALVKAVPMAKIDAVNDVLGRWFSTKYGDNRGIIVLGRDLPYGIGAAIGAGGNAVLGLMTVRGARRAFGPAPQDWPSKPPPDLTR